MTPAIAGSPERRKSNDDDDDDNDDDASAVGARARHAPLSRPSSPTIPPSPQNQQDPVPRGWRECPPIGLPVAGPLPGSGRLVPCKAPLSSRYDRVVGGERLRFTPQIAAEMVMAMVSSQPGYSGVSRWKQAQLSLFSRACPPVRQRENREAPPKHQRLTTLTFPLSTPLPTPKSNPLRAPSPSCSTSPTPPATTTQRSSRA